MKENVFFLKKIRHLCISLFLSKYRLVVRLEQVFPAALAATEFVLHIENCADEGDDPSGGADQDHVPAVKPHAQGNAASAATPIEIFIGMTYKLFILRGLPFFRIFVCKSEVEERREYEVEQGDGGCADEVENGAEAGEC